VFEVKLLI